MAARRSHDPLVDTLQSDRIVSRPRLLAVNQQEPVSGTRGRGGVWPLGAGPKNALLVNSIQKGRGLSAVKELFGSRPRILPHRRLPTLRGHMRTSGATSVLNGPPPASVPGAARRAARSTNMPMDIGAECNLQTANAESALTFR